MAIDPPVKAVSQGEQFTLDILVTPGQAIAGAQCNVSFDSSLITADLVTEGDLLSQGGAGTFFLEGTIDNMAGTITGMAAAITEAATVSDEGVFATITFTADATNGDTPITLSNVIVADASGDPVAIEVSDGSVTVEAPEVSVTIDAPDEVAAGSDFVARVNIDEVTGLDAYQFDVTYDPSVIEIIGVEGGIEGVTPGMIDSTSIRVDMWMFQPIGIPGTIRVLGNLPGVSGVTGTGYLAEIHFHVVGEIGSSSDITLSNGKLFDNMGSQIPATWLGASVNVTVQCGDANGDGVVDMGDVTKVERIILELDSPTPGADANQDGEIDMGDVTKIERIILGLD